MVVVDLGERNILIELYENEKLQNNNGRTDYL